MCRRGDWGERAGVDGSEDDGVYCLFDSLFRTNLDGPVGKKHRRAVNHSFAVARTGGSNTMVSGAWVYAMLGNENLWSTALTCHHLLAKANIPHALIGGVAVFLHGYQRNTVDVDVLVRGEDSTGIREAMRASGFQWDPDQKEFRAPSGVLIQLVVAGTPAGRGSSVLLPDPADTEATETIEGLPVLRLSRLIESKLACGESNLRRTHRDFADVVELIAVRQLDASFAGLLHKSLRKTFRELVRRARSG